MSEKGNSKKKNIKLQDLVYMAIGAVIITVCSWISIPAAVPFTLQTFAVFLVVSLLGGKRGTVSILVYILLGAVGVPVFSGMTGGFIKLIGVTGGYIIGFIFVGLIYWLSEVVFKRSCSKMRRIMIHSLVQLAGLLICYAFGTAWFMVAYAQSSGPVGLGAALGMCVVPFIIPDIIKMAAAIVLAERLRKPLHIQA